ncbi:hypothetical protein RhiirC2_775999 [Rhizophagus irregularis]|uniref:Uncharacterized protein n=1 Tax=Rhizophagus irregularis TaxID=588596 RepID=A0A2N1NHY3_9GLOM|nr:hypothetical protein RhiirC2_775999 [Rhizophagus irregularis]
MPISDGKEKVLMVCVMQYIFKNWTSGNNDHIDKFIKDTQLSAHTFTFNALEWISYDKFYKFIAKGGLMDV